MVVNGDHIAWNQGKHSIQAECGDWRLKIDPYNPQKLMTVDRGSRSELVELAITPMPDHEFQPEEIYIREEDLITRYRQSESDLVSLQLNWRLLPRERSITIAFEVWISLQTRLLDIHPTLALSLNGPADWCPLNHSDLARDQLHELHFSADTTAAWESVSQDAACLWIIDPRDQLEFSWNNNQSTPQLKAYVFGSFLEKGVIRRARFRFYLSSNSMSKEAVKAVYGDLITSSLPLTA